MNIFLEIAKSAQIGRYLILVIFLSTLLISESEVCTADTNIGYGFWTTGRDTSNYQPDWSALTHIAYSDWKVNSDGSLEAPPNMIHFITVRDLAHSHGKKFIITVGCNNPSTMDSILANHREDFANNVLNTVQEYGADGVNVDFEFPQQTNSITKTPNKALFESFMNTLHTTLKTANPGYHISIDTTSRTHSVYANSNLAKYLDHIVIMEYDFQKGQGKTGSNSPYNDPSRYDVLKSVSDWDNYFNKQQMILALPLYGYQYSSATDQPGSTFTKIQQLDMKVAVQTADQYGRLWDSNSNTPWCRYYDGSSWHQIWYDDAQSLKLKYDYIKSQNIDGVAFWALNCETSDVWEVF
jgi:spore germination protein YaaH